MDSSTLPKMKEGYPANYIYTVFTGYQQQQKWEKKLYWNIYVNLQYKDTK